MELVKIKVEVLDCDLEVTKESLDKIIEKMASWVCEDAVEETSNPHRIFKDMNTPAIKELKQGYDDLKAGRKTPEADERALYYLPDLFCEIGLANIFYPLVEKEVRRRFGLPEEGFNKD